jgi:hypothetical protein
MDVEGSGCDTIFGHISEFVCWDQDIQEPPGNSVFGVRFKHRNSLKVK